MNRNLITQIKNEGRDNLWLIVEFTIVALVVWILTSNLYHMISRNLEEKGFDIENVYKISLRKIDKDNPKYVADADQNEDMRTLIAAIRKSPYVDVAAFSNNAIPYSYNYMGNQLDFYSDGDTAYFAGNLRMGSPGIARVLQLKSPDGITADALDEMLTKGEVFVSESPSEQFSGVNEPRELVGRRTLFMDTVNTRRVGAVIYSVRRNEYESAGGTIFAPIDENGPWLKWANSVAVRVKPGMGQKFEEEFFATPEMRRMRNVYLSEFTSMQKARTINQRGKDNEKRLYFAGIVFMLVIIFLGLLGTFWFRIKQRTPEIALRKVCGATSADVFRRITGEGLLLLLISMIPVAMIGVSVIYFVLNKDGLPFAEINWVQYGVSFVATMALMAIIIIVGVVIPARRAMTIEPAIAIKEE